jgi:predicted glycoside hydrolase/deacetylase ChbG (UPF0249 family)
MAIASNARQVILTADDFGFSAHTVDWTIKCFEAGVLSSATIMVATSATERAFEYAKRNRQWSFGLHLCLTDERPACKPSEIPSLVTSDGKLLPTRVFVKRAFLGRLAPNELDQEIRCQLNRICDAGIPPTHVDGHGHMHRIPAVLRSLMRVAPEYGIGSVRPAQNFYYPYKARLGTKMLNSLVNKTLRRHFSGPDHFAMTSGKITSEHADWFRMLIARLPCGVTEIGVHPGVDEEWRRLDTVRLLESGLSDLNSEGIEVTSYHRYKSTNG